MKKNVRLRAALPVAVVLLLPGPALAATCQIAAQTVAFGGYDTLDPQPLDGVGNVAVSCDAETSFTITLGTGAGSFDAREMTSGTDALEYNLYTDATRLVVWGDGTGGTEVVAGTATMANVTVYGRVPARQPVPAGEYADALVVTIEY